MIERRMTAGSIELRQAEEGPGEIAGVASVFYDGSRDTEYQLWPGAVERIDKNAFDRAIEERHDAVALVNHDPSQLLGRVSNGTVSLRVGKTGLEYRVQLPDTQLAKDTRELISQGTMRGSSFGFEVLGEEWTEGRDGDEPDVRLITDLRLFDVSAVTFPAYEGASVEARDDARASYDAWRKKSEQEAEEAASRTRLLMDARLMEIEGRIPGR